MTEPVDPQIILVTLVILLLGLSVVGALVLIQPPPCVKAVDEAVERCQSHACTADDKAVCMDYGRRMLEGCTE